VGSSRGPLLSETAVGSGADEPFEATPGRGTRPPSRGTRPPSLTPKEISDRLLVASASTTATLDLLERRGWARRTPNPDDRRSTLVEVTDDGRTAADQLLAGIRILERDALALLTPEERQQLLDLLGKVLSRLAALAQAPPTPLEGRRHRPARLDPAT